MILPGIGGSVYERYGFASEADKNIYLPTIVKTRRKTYAQTWNSDCKINEWSFVKCGFRGFIKFEELAYQGISVSSIINFRLYKFFASFCVAKKKRGPLCLEQNFGHFLNPSLMHPHYHLRAKKPQKIRSKTHERIRQQRWRQQLV